MDDAFRRKVLAYLGELRSALRMDNWDVVLKAEPCSDDEAHAETWQHENHTVLNVALSKDFDQLSPEGVRNTLTHELVHAQHRDVTRLWEKASRGALSETAVTAWDEEFHVHMERFVAWIADRIDGTMPVFDPSKAAPKKLAPGLYLHDTPK